MPVQLFEGLDHATRYAKYRHTIPNSTVEIVMELLKRNLKLKADSDIMVDVGCGSGQVAESFAPHFRQIHAVDPSENQIQLARANSKADNVTYSVGFAENLPFIEDGSVVLVTAMAAVHWFDQIKFYEECRRILKPGGLVVLVNYSSTRANVCVPENPPDSDDVSDPASSSKSTRLQSAWERFTSALPWQPQSTSNFYQNLPRPSADVFHYSYLPGMGEIVRKWSVGDAMGYISTLSACNGLLTEGSGDGMLKGLEREMKGILGEDADRSDLVFSFNLFGIVLRKL